MRLKLFRAPTVNLAIALVRRELGADALILSTRRVQDGVEVTAALEGDAAPPSALPAPIASPPPSRLAWHGVPPELQARLEAGPLEDMLEATLRFGALPFGPAAPPLLLTGPPGAGKTLTTARLATRLTLAGTPPLVVTADGRRAGAAKQLAAFTRVLGLPLLVADEPVALSRALARRERGAPVLIDSAGLDPFDPHERDELAGLAGAAGATLVLVLPAGLDPAESADLAGAFAEAGTTLLVPTRLDLARRLGGILAAAATGHMLTEAGVGPGAADGLALPDPCRPCGAADGRTGLSPTPPEFRMTIQAASRPPAATTAGPPPLGRTVAIASGKDGVGKTWFATTLAHALARHDRRVLLFDADLGLANIDIQLGLTPRHDLGAVAAGTVTMAQAVERFAPGGFDILAGSSGSGALSALDGPGVERLLAALATTAAGYDNVLLDLGAGLDRAVRRMSAWADTLLVVTTEEPTSLTDAYAALKLHAADRAGGDARLVVNQITSPAAGERTAATLARACTAFLGRAPALAGYVRRDPHVSDAIRRQAPLLIRHPNCSASQDVEAIAANLLGA